MSLISYIQARYKNLLSGQNIRRKKSVYCLYIGKYHISRMLIYRKTPIVNTMTRYIRKERRYSHIIQAVIYIKALFSLYTEILWAGGKLKKKKWFIYKINTPMYIGKIHIQRIYLDKIYKKKASFFYIYSKTHIFLGKCLISIYIRKTYTTIWAKYKRNVQTKKCYFYYKENTIYNTHFWGKI